MVYESDKEKNSADVDLERTFVFLNHPPPSPPSNTFSNYVYSVIDSMMDIIKD
jgi:hypothetical protein